MHVIISSSMKGLNQPDISFSSSKMALVASSCSQLTWPLWDSSPLCGAPWLSFPLLLFPPAGVLIAVFSFLFSFVPMRNCDSPSKPSCCEPAVSSSCSSSPLLFAEDRDSCDLVLVSPLRISLKWDVKVLSGSSDLSWEGFSCEEFTAGCGGWRGGVLYWETTIVGRAEAGRSLLPSESWWFSVVGAEESGCGSGTGFSFGTSVSGLEFCKEKQKHW